MEAEIGERLETVGKNPEGERKAAENRRGRRRERRAGRGSNWGRGR